MVLIVSAQTVFDWKDRYGMPFGMIFKLMEEKRAICNLDELLNIAVSRGWNRKRTAVEIEDAWRAVYPVGEAFREWCGE